MKVTVRSHAVAVSACHCSMCRRWSGAAMWVLEAPGDAVEVTGPVQRYRSSSFAERAWCAECGTQLWIKDDDGPYEVSPGLFDGARGLPLSHEIYVDQAFASVVLAGEHKRMTRAEYEASERYVEGEA
ncbi:GFA family protein [Roseovarius ramblicola]|uniref:GFA family protein n=1 Tax=Roseovarius ramblicola TaxID=2022336 RepID=A0ABV5HZT5_9RHOB